MTRYSLSEIEAQSRKATRGAGYSWGLAEEAGYAVRWLEARGMPGVVALSGMLQVQDSFRYDDLRPENLDTIWQAKSGALCPLIAGVTLSDFQFQSPPTLDRVRYPLMLVPFLKSCGLSHPALPSEATDLLDLSDQPLSESKNTLLSVSATSREIPSEAWSVLDHFAHRTYVPATELSRSGAGAGVTDND